MMTIHYFLTSEKGCIQRYGYLSEVVVNVQMKAFLIVFMFSGTKGEVFPIIFNFGDFFSSYFACFTIKQRIYFEQGLQNENLSC